ncbi:tetratricopeptide repeat protein [Belliella kenyensis]|uniref:Tetratricopeptide repeat protein n=1 Tax=Belliella kenyensis TaxID=1472724 RepID=A0ABV8EN36_9BACT|nr:tetratricopeptide repeat protein [Belliella kenyensis]MCH7402103.1 tetratricopeptide repeat protein [Belliella kenyensis]MDN3601545.1 tetratricopeptide repeat protein [Belliella kenyensis]
MHIRSLIFVVFISFLGKAAHAQYNCEWFKAQGNMVRYQACLEANKSNEFYQFSKEFHEVYDRVMEMDPTWALPYRAKSVSYLKSGDFINWKKLIDQAVAYDTVTYLGYRAGCRFQFFRDYKGAIEDCLLLKKVMNNDMGYTANGQYHLDIVLALSYKALGDPNKAIETILERHQEANYMMGIFDMLHLGVLYAEQGDLQKAKACFEKQEAFNDLAENRYYLAMVYKELGQKENYIEQLEKAKSLYTIGLKMNDPYQAPMDKIYLKQIEIALAEHF